MAKRSRTLAMLAAVAVFAAACSSTPAASTAPQPSVAASVGAASGAPAASANSAALPTPEKTDIKIGLSVTETSQCAAKLAELAGIY